MSRQIYQVQILKLIIFPNLIRYGGYGEMAKKVIYGDMSKSEPSQQEDTWSRFWAILKLSHLDFSCIWLHVRHVSFDDFLSHLTIPPVWRDNLQSVAALSRSWDWLMICKISYLITGDIKTLTIHPINQSMLKKWTSSNSEELNQKQTAKICCHVLTYCEYWIKNLTPAHSNTNLQRFIFSQSNKIIFQV